MSDIKTLEELLQQALELVKACKKEKKVVVVEGVIWERFYVKIIPISRVDSIDWAQFLDKPKMKMTLEWEE